MDTSFWSDTKNLGKSIVHIKGCHVTISKKYCVLLSEDLFTFTNDVDPDEMQHYAAFHLGLHCL